MAFPKFFGIFFVSFLIPFSPTGSDGSSGELEDLIFDSSCYILIACYYSNSCLKC